MSHPTLVRHAVASDIPALVVLEQQAWSTLNTPVYTADHFMTWLDVHPIGFSVATCGETVVGYSYAQARNFCFADIPRYAHHDEATDFGYTRATCDPLGDSFQGVSIVSIQRGAGQALYTAFYELLHRLRKRYYFGFPRLAGFDAYMKALEAEGRCIPPVLEKEVALWYARVCTEMVGGKIWDICPTPSALALPVPEKKDPILSLHLKNPAFGLVGIIPNFMNDSPSRNYAAFHVYEVPR